MTDAPVDLAAAMGAAIGGAESCDYVVVMLLLIMAMCGVRAFERAVAERVVMGRKKKKNAKVRTFEIQVGIRRQRAGGHWGCFLRIGFWRDCRHRPPAAAAAHAAIDESH
jgi:hypothetical protein